MTPTAALLEVQGLSAGYGRGTVLAGVDLRVDAGQIVGLLGRNGMGKSTLVRCVMGQLALQSGRLRWRGTDITGQPAHRVARAGVAVVPEGRQVFANLSVREHLSAFERSGPDGSRAWTTARVFDLFPRLGQRRSHLGAQLSGGEQQMLAIGRALVTNPLLLILDEATEGLAPLVRLEIWRALRLLAAEGHAMLVIDKYVQQLVQVAQQHVILEKGRVAWTGSSADLDADRGLWARYLGA